jgi:capsular polysaccharide export protein
MGHLFNRIAKWKRSLGHAVTQVLFNGGDHYFCSDPEAVEFRQSLSEWPLHLLDLIVQHDIDGVLLFGQSRPIHREAIRICRELGISVFVMEEGYIRPGFMTLELGGVNAESTTLSTYRLDENFPAAATITAAKVKHHRLRITWHAMLYFFFLKLGARYYKGYIHHRHTSILRYTSYWVGAALHYPVSRWHDRKSMAVFNHRRPFFFVPLQIDSDAQVVYHSCFLNVMSFAEEVMKSFALHSPSDVQLVIKQHPLARGHIGMRASILSMAERYGIRHRLVYIYSCKIHELLEKSEGVVTINSTVGVQAIARAVPLKVMGLAIYDHPDVVDSQPLDEFWRNPRKPDPAKALAYHRALKILTQVPVAIYDPVSTPLCWSELLSEQVGGRD